MSTKDTCVTIVPYFKTSEENLSTFKSYCDQFIEKTKTESACLHYGFSFSGTMCHCREGYANAEGLLAHLANVGELLGEVLKIATIERLEVHGPAEELEKLKGPLADLNPEYYTLEYGFRN